MRELASRPGALSSLLRSAFVCVDACRLESKLRRCSCGGSSVATRGFYGYPQNSGTESILPCRRWCNPREQFTQALLVSTSVYRDPAQNIPRINVCVLFLLLWQIARAAQPARPVCMSLFLAQRHSPPAPKSHQSDYLCWISSARPRRVCHCQACRGRGIYQERTTQTLTGQAPLHNNILCTSPFTAYRQEAWVSKSRVLPFCAKPSRTKRDWSVLPSPAI